MIDDLIRRRDAVERITDAIWHVPNQMYPSFNQYDIIRKIVADAVKGLPSAQPEEIIRCKDCRYGVDYYHDGNCYCAKPGYELLYFDGSWEFYCANAEREAPHEP